MCEFPQNLHKLIKELRSGKWSENKTTRKELLREFGVNKEKDENGSVVVEQYLFLVSSLALWHALHIYM